MSEPMSSILGLFALVAGVVMAARIAYVAAVRGLQLAITFGIIVADALMLTAMWPIEWLIDQSAKCLAFAAEWHEQRKIWRKEFRHRMPWDEFRRQLTGQARPQRDDYAVALGVFDLAEPFTREELNARFKRIMQGVHPDTGGSNYLAQQVTDARALILKRKGWKK